MIKVNSRAEYDRSKLDGGKVDSSEVEVDKVRKKDQNLFKSKKTVEFLDFVTSGAKLVFIKLR